MSEPGNPFDLTDKVAIVTGSTKGIGRAMASGLARAGATVVVSSRKQDLCDQVAKEFEAETGRPALGLACHVGDWDAIPGFVETVHERLGHIDVLVNNAAITPSRSGVTDIGQDVWRKIFSVNVEGPLRMAQCVAPVMRDHGGGSIVNIASMAAYSGGSLVCAYGASKAALVNLTKSMSQEWVSWNIRVNVLSPGPFLSEMVEGAERNAPGFKDMIAAGTLMKRVADPSEIVGPVLYLASDASSYVTGDDISVSGGMMK
jgi:NAD(P)-dependent dehydrogenase (short-subunit alcohol dehydrogenase family)